ncbi:hypothetical protein FSC37_05060 [Piscinibacter aquaticus]|uniref:Tail specific protease domain-containing protein n=1 Tax=Piscinibacter aquaticus TaxID=392597 RepID=A0A5C6U1L4_9BURK|nr:hypothetical protein FSC37_05060 [Piscinibacter aquaticus]
MKHAVPSSCLVRHLDRRRRAARGLWRGRRWLVRRQCRLRRGQPEELAAQLHARLVLLDRTVAESGASRLRDARCLLRSAEVHELPGRAERHRSLERLPEHGELQPVLRRGPQHRLWRLRQRPRSPAAAEDPLHRAAVSRRPAGLRRGDVIKAINGVPDTTLITGNFSVLSGAAGQQITLDIERNGTPQRVTLTAADYALTPVSASATLTAGTAKVGYIVLKDFIVQAEPELTSRLNAIKAAGATDRVIDLRYNGGGRISTANHFASEVVGPRGVFTTLQYNSKQQASNRSFTLTASTAAGVFNRIVVLTGPRSCSASELLINGLRPYAQQVSTIGSTSCGKPYGFNPVESCSNTFSIVNFKAVNSLGQGDYEAGITPTCAVADDFSGALGDPTEKLTAAALGYLQTGNCPATAAAPSADRARALAARLQRAGAEPGERRGMTAD